jgi:hypothetical protein
MTNSGVIPATRSGRTYRTVLILVGLSAIVGIADAGRGLLWMGLEATAGAEPPPLDVAKKLLMLLAWCLLGLAAYDGWRRKVIPATWLLGGVVALTWALILIQRIG